MNVALERYGFPDRVDHRSYERQGIDKIPSIHMGVAAMQMEQRGIITDRGNINREIAVTNNQLRQLRARVNKVKLWLDDNKANTSPTLHEVLNSILRPGDERTHYQEIADLKLAAKVDEMHRDCNDAYDRKKKTEKRVKTLDEHLANCDTFKKNRKVHEMYAALNAEYESFSKQSGLFAKSKTEKHYGFRHWYGEGFSQTPEYNKAHVSVHRTVKNLEQKGLITIKHAISDKRNWCLTEKGIDLLKKCRPDLFE